MNTYKSSFTYLLLTSEGLLTVEKEFFAIIYFRYTHKLEVLMTGAELLAMGRGRLNVLRGSVPRCTSYSGA
jgi:hypothetical protein